MNYEKLLRKMRQRIFDYPPEKEEKAANVLKKVKEKFLIQDFPRANRIRLERESRYMRMME
jgi:hypothetical protein